MLRKRQCFKRRKSQCPVLWDRGAAWSSAQPTLRRPRKTAVPRRGKVKTSLLVPSSVRFGGTSWGTQMEGILTVTSAGAGSGTRLRWQGPAAAAAPGRLLTCTPPPWPASRCSPRRSPRRPTAPGGRRALSAPAARRRSFAGRGRHSHPVPLPPLALPRAGPRPAGPRRPPPFCSRGGRCVASPSPGQPAAAAGVATRPPSPPRPRGRPPSRLAFLAGQASWRRWVRRAGTGAAAFSALGAGRREAGTLFVPPCPSRGLVPPCQEPCDSGCDPRARGQDRWPEARDQRAPGMAPGRHGLGRGGSDKVWGSVTVIIVIFITTLPFEPFGLATCCPATIPSFQCVKLLRLQPYGNCSTLYTALLCCRLSAFSVPSFLWWLSVFSLVLCHACESLHYFCPSPPWCLIFAAFRLPSHPRAGRPAPM